MQRDVLRRFCDDALPSGITPIFTLVANVLHFYSIIFSCFFQEMILKKLNLQIKNPTDSVGFLIYVIQYSA